jgi:hypothetical protein
MTEITPITPEQRAEATIANLRHYESLWKAYEISQQQASPGTITVTATNLERCPRCYTAHIAGTVCPQCYRK